MMKQFLRMGDDDDNISHGLMSNSNDQSQVTSDGGNNRFSYFVT